MALTAFSCMSGSTWEYVSNFMDMFACPSIVIPAQTQQFAFPQPGGDGQDVQGSQACLADVYEQSLGLLWSKWLHLFLRLPRSRDGVADVAREDVVSHGLLQGLAQDGVDYLHGPGRKPRVQLLSVVTAHIARLQSPQPHAS